MAESLLNGFETLDLQMREILLNASNEKMVEEAVRNYTFTMTLGKLYVTKRDYGGNRRDDGTIFMDSKGFNPVGINESKYAHNGKRVLGSMVYGQFAQAIKYHSLSPIKTHKFIWLSHNDYFKLIKIEDNLELIQNLEEIYSRHPEVAPYNVWSLNEVTQAFKDRPLVIYRSWDIDNNFNFSEVLDETLGIINESN